MKKIVQDCSIFCQIVKKDTFKTDQTSSLIDHIIVNNFATTELQKDFLVIIDHEIIGAKLYGNHGNDSCIKFLEYRRLDDEMISNLIEELTGANVELLNSC